MLLDCEMIKDRDSLKRLSVCLACCVTGTMPSRIQDILGNIMSYLIDGEAYIFDRSQSNPHFKDSEMIESMLDTCAIVIINVVVDLQGFAPGWVLVQQGK